MGSIAIVHVTLSQTAEGTVAFDAISDRLCAMVTEVSAVGGGVKVRRAGSFGEVTSDQATALAMVLTEVLQNAVEHGYPDAGAEGEILVDVRRSLGRLTCTVTDDGVGVAEGFDLDTSTHLGLSIVRTLVESELGGQLALDRAGARGGTRVRVDVPGE